MFQYINDFKERIAFGSLIILCIFSALISSSLLLYESLVIDMAINRVVDKFILYLVVYMLSLLTLQISEALIGVIQVNHRARMGLKYETWRIQKANKVKFSITETREFHSLLEETSKVLSADEENWKAIQNGLNGLLRLVFSVIILYRMNIVVTAVMVSMIAVCTIISVYSYRTIGDIWRVYIDNMRYPNYLSKVLLHREYAPERKVFNYRTEISERYQKTYNEALKNNKSLGKRRLKLESIVTIITSAYTVAIVIILAAFFAEGQLSMGNLSAAFTASITLRGIGNKIYESIYIFYNNKIKFERYGDFMKLAEIKPEGKEIIDDIESVEFNHVCFKYPGSNEQVLSDVSFSIKKGQHFALVGENGSGKSTLVKLLCGLYKPDSGEILFNDKNINNISDGEKKRLISVMYQDFYHYPLQIRELVCLQSGEKIKDSDIKGALMSLGLDEERINHLLNGTILKGKNNSIDISGGEWQKITAASTLMATTPLVIMDEPNANMDPKSESLFLELFKKKLKEKGTLLVSHRLGAVKDADQILVLKEGKVEGIGTHSELMVRCEYYKELYETQKGLYEKVI